MKREDYGAKPFEKEWLWSLDEDGNGDGIWTNRESCREFAIMKAIENRSEEDRLTENVYVAESQEYIPYIFADIILERLSEDAWEECGEASEDSFKATGSQAKDLEEMLNNALGHWLTKHGLWPSFSKLGPIEKINVEQYISETQSQDK